MLSFRLGIGSTRFDSTLTLARTPQQEMWDGEKKHIAVFDRLITQHQVRPTLLYPLWKVAGLAVGATTALMGKRSAMACTEAVETVIGEHYDS